MISLHRSTSLPSRPVRRRSTPPTFTFVEIMIVIVMIGVLATLTIPGFSQITTKSQGSAMAAPASNHRIKSVVPR